MYRAFTLVELMVVCAIMTLLGSLLLPVFLTVRGSARGTVCRSNLQQIGVATALYTQDSDGLYLYGIDHFDRYIKDEWSTEPAFKAQIPALPFVKDLLNPYLKSKQVFTCPSDTGYDYEDFGMRPLAGRPSSALVFGSSYAYNTGLAILASRVGQEKDPHRKIRSLGDEILFLDCAGDWHGTLVPVQRRYNVVFTDTHIENMSSAEIVALRDPDLFPTRN